MPYIPKAVCVKCREEFRIDKNGVTLHVMVKGQNRHYYSIDTDQWKCPKCGVEVLLGFAVQPYATDCEIEEIKPMHKEAPEVTIEL